MEEYFAGKKLYGDDFSLEEIKEWYESEVEGYADLGSKDRESYKYPYHSMNIFYGYNKLPENLRFKKVLGLGSAYGDEFFPIIDKIDAITILEPSDQLKVSKIKHLDPDYSKPDLNGKIHFPDNTFDLIICYSVLHHIPNVSYVLSELKRVLSPGGYLILREPIITMGDWRKPRKGLTKNERGIPLPFFESFIKSSNLTPISQSLCDCAFAYKSLGRIIKRDSFLYQNIDNVLSKMFKWNYKYHRVSNWEKVCPSSIFLVLRKSDN